MAPASSWGSTPSDLIFPTNSAFVQDDGKPPAVAPLAWATLGCKSAPVNGSGRHRPINLDRYESCHSQAGAQVHRCGRRLPMVCPRLALHTAAASKPGASDVLRGGFGLFYDMEAQIMRVRDLRIGSVQTTTFSRFTSPLPYSGSNHRAPLQHSGTLRELRGTMRDLFCDK